MQVLWDSVINRVCHVCTTPTASVNGTFDVSSFLLLLRVSDVLGRLRKVLRLCKKLMKIIKSNYRRERHYSDEKCQYGDLSRVLFQSTHARRAKCIIKSGPLISH